MGHRPFWWMLIKVVRENYRRLWSTLLGSNKFIPTFYGETGLFAAVLQALQLVKTDWISYESWNNEAIKCYITIHKFICTSNPAGRFLSRVDFLRGCWFCNLHLWITKSFKLPELIFKRIFHKFKHILLKKLPPAAKKRDVSFSMEFWKDKIFV